MFKLDGVFAFVASVEAGSISAASRRLGLAKSVVSERVAELERALETLGRMLEQRKFEYEIAVVGGSALLLLGIIHRPTNDLDVETLEALSECLSEFAGAVILVSHDRYFMDQNCDVIWALDSDSGLITTFSDTYQWEEWHTENKNAAKKAANKSVKSSNTKAGLNNKEKFEFEKMEATIAEDESLLKKLQEELISPATATNFSRLTELSTHIGTLEKKIESLFTRWDELTQKNK